MCAECLVPPVAVSGDLGTGNFVLHVGMTRTASRQNETVAVIETVRSAPQRLVCGEIRHDAFEPPRVLVLDRHLAMLQAGLTTGHEVVTPLRELRRRHAMAPKVSSDMVNLTVSMIPLPAGVNQ